MNRTAKIIIICLIGIVIVGAGIYLLTRNSSPKSTNNTQTNSQDTTSQTSSPDADAQTTGETATITYTNSGFSPETLTVTAGTMITIKNDSSEDLQFSSDDHPTHTHNTELNETTIGPDQTETLTLTSKGTWGYHNHLDANKTGTIIVQ